MLNLIYLQEKDMPIKLLITFLPLLFLSCHNRQEVSVAELKPNRVIIDEVPLVADTIKPDSLYYPSEMKFSARLITTGVFHNDEIWEDINDIKWVGIFKNSDSYYIERTKLYTSRVHDVFVDTSENEKTAWKIDVENKDSLLVLLSGLELPKGKITDIKLDKYMLLPGESVDFDYRGIKYVLSAIGDKKIFERNEMVVYNYKLYISSTKNHKKVRQLLASWPHMDDNMMYILFAGDIDNDNLPDLLIDTSGHYNAIIPTLYLSKHSVGDSLVKPVASHTAVGC